jgi:diguanylate cyclase (GGDEF)-like protein
MSGFSENGDWTLSLDLETIFIYSSAMNLLVIAVTTVGWLRFPARRDSRYWSIAAWLAVIGPAVLMVGDKLPYHAVGYLGGLIHIASTGFIRLGFSAFYGRPARTREAFYVALATMLTLILSNLLTGGSTINVAAIYVAIAVNLAWVAATVWRGRTAEKLPSRSIATIIIAGYALGTLAVAPFAYFKPVTFSDGMPVSSWMAFSTIPLVLLNLSTYLMMLVLTLERSVERHRELADEDTLTGAMSRRAFHDSIAAHSGKNGVLAIIDLDHFKAVNDTYGHQVGDDVLRALAATAKNHLPADALFGRLGGEEFGLCFSGYDVSTAHAHLENLRAEFERLEFSLLERPPFGVTLSCGYSSFHAGGWDIETKFAEADCALYAAKSAGRNMVLFFEPSQLLTLQFSQGRSRPTMGLAGLQETA